jgi:hypothetical protein
VRVQGNGYILYGVSEVLFMLSSAYSGVEYYYFLSLEIKEKPTGIYTEWN